MEFLARLTLHILDRYQNIRRYAGFYSSVVHRRVRATRNEYKAAAVDEGRPVKPSWARLIARIFGAIPVACPRCDKGMELAEFVLDGEQIRAEFPELARAPPMEQFERYVAPVGDPTYSPEYENDEAACFDQRRPERDEDFNQDFRAVIITTGRRSHGRPDDATCPHRFFKLAFKLSVISIG